MTKVICDWMMCMYNESTVLNEAGVCKKEEIRLKHRDSDELEGKDVPEEVEYNLLDCIDFTYDSEKGVL